MVAVSNKESLERFKQQRLNYPSKNIEKVHKEYTKPTLHANKGQKRHP